MENLTPWKTIKIGIFLGIGILVPMAIWDMVFMGASYKIASLSIEGFTEEITETKYDESSFPSIKDFSSEIDLGEYTSSVQGNQLLITGTITNKASETVKSIEIEAELFDADGNFVYECSEYINTKLGSGETENYLIKCGCSKNGVPDFDSFKLKISRATAY